MVPNTRYGNSDPYRQFCPASAGAGGVVWFYLYKALLPLNLYFVYPQWHIETHDLLWWLPLIAALSVTVVLWRYRMVWSRPLLFAWGFFCVSLLPVLGFIDVGYMQYSLVADHYQHIAIIGVIALVSALWGLWHERMRGATHWAATIVAIMAVGTLTFLTFQQNGMYSNAMTLYQATLEKNPDCWMAHNNLGSTLDDMDRPWEAIEHCQQALRLKADYFEAHNNLGVALGKLGRLSESLEHFQQSLQINPNYSEAHNNLGITLCKTGRPLEAIKHFQQALQGKPDFPEAQSNLGNALVQAGRSHEAIEHYQQALRMKPDFPEAHNNLGNIFKVAGQYQQAIDHYRQAILYKPDSAQTYYNMALAYAKISRPEEALAAAQQALNLAHSKGQTALAKKIEEWLNSNRASLSN